jgi:hypothetical protein
MTTSQQFRFELSNRELAKRTREEEETGKMIKAMSVLIIMLIIGCCIVTSNHPAVKKIFSLQTYTTENVLEGVKKIL